MRFKAVVWIVLVFFLNPVAEMLSAANEPNTNFEAETLDFANGLYTRKMYEPAAAEYEKFIKQNPSSSDLASAYFRDADCFYFLKKYQQAIPLFKRFMQDYPQDGRLLLALFRVGGARLELGQAPQALRIFHRLLQEVKEPNLKGASYYYLAKAYEVRGRSDKLQYYLERLMLELPQTEYASYGSLLLGDSYSKEHHFGEADKAYRLAAGKAEPFEVMEEARLKIAEIHFNLKEYPEARTAYQRILKESLPANVPQAQKASERAWKQKALLGLFYCDYYLQDLDSAKAELEQNRSLINDSLQKRDIFYLMANLLAQAKEYDGALSYLEQTLAVVGPDDPLSANAVLKKASVLSQKGQMDLALAQIQSLLDRTVKDKDRALYEKANLLQQMNRYQEALDVYSIVIKDFSKTRYARMSLYQVGLVQKKMEDPVSAWTSFELYRKRYPGSSDSEQAALEMIQLDIQTKNFERSKDRARAFLIEYPKSDWSDTVYYKEAVALAGLKQYEEAARIFGTLWKQYPNSKLNPEALYGAAASFESASKLKEAVSYYEKLTGGFPNHSLTAEVLPHLGYLYIACGQPQNAKTLYLTLLAAHSAVKLDTDAVFWLIRYLLDTGDYTRMQQILEMLPKRFPDRDLSHETHFFLGESAMGLKDYKKALAEYNEAIKLKSQGSFTGSAYLGIGIAALTLGDQAQAENAFNEALRFDQEPRVGLRARFEIANLRLTQNKPEEAAKAFMLVAILYDDAKYVPVSLYKAGECFQKMNKTDEAQKAFAELENRFPKSEWTQKFQALSVSAKKS